MTAISVVRIERRHVDGDFSVGEGRVVLGVEEARIDRLEMDRLPSSHEAGRAEIEQAARSEFGDQGAAFWPRQQHGVTKMLAAARAPKHVRQE